MTAVLMTPPFLQFFDANGAPLAGGKIYTYTATGTFATAKATYTTAAGDVEHPNPVILNASGVPATGNGSIWLSGTYDFVVKDSNDVEIETTLNVTAFTTTSSSATAYFESFSGTGAQTAFTTSTDLGTDEKAIYVWVDAGGGKGYDLQAPTVYTINGTTLTFSSAPASGTNNIYVSAPSSLVGAASAAAADAAASAAAALSSQNAAAASEAAAATSAAALIGTSTTSLLIEVASKTFTTQAGKQFTAGDFVIASSDADPTNYMHGQVTSYSSTTLIVDITNIGGSGTYADWTIHISGTRGVKGDTGSISDLSGVTGATPTSSDKLVFVDVDNGNVTRSATVLSVVQTASSLIQLSQQVISADAFIEFDNTIITNSYTKYLFIWESVVTVSAGNSFNFYMSTDNGSSYLSAYKSHTQACRSGANTYAGVGTVTTLIHLGQGVEADGSHGLLVLSNPANSSLVTQIYGLTTNASTGTTYEGGSVIGSSGTTTTAVNAVKFQGSGASLTSGTITAYGIL